MKLTPQEARELLSHWTRRPASNDDDRTAAAILYCTAVFSRLKKHEEPETTHAFWRPACILGRDILHTQDAETRQNLTDQLAELCEAEIRRRRAAGESIWGETPKT